MSESMFTIAGKSIFEESEWTQLNDSPKKYSSKNIFDSTNDAASSTTRNLTAKASSNIPDQPGTQFEDLPLEILEKIINFALNNYDKEKIYQQNRLFVTMLSLSKKVATTFCESVTTMEISRENTVLSDLLNMLHKFSRLKKLVLRGNIQKENFFARLVSSSASKSAVVPHTGLQVLEFKAEAVMMGRLKSLFLHGEIFKRAIVFKPLKKSDLLGLANWFPNIRKFYFENQFEMTDEVIIELADQFPGMNSISLDSSVKLTDKSIMYLTDKCGSLTEISLVGCGKLTDNAVINLSNQCKNLAVVNVKKCPLITQLAISHLLEKSPGITGLEEIF